MPVGAIQLGVRGGRPMQWVRGQSPTGLATLSPEDEAKCCINLQILTALQKILD